MSQCVILMESMNMFNLQHHPVNNFGLFYGSLNECMYDGLQCEPVNYGLLLWINEYVDLQLEVMSNIDPFNKSVLMFGSEFDFSYESMNECISEEFWPSPPASPVAVPPGNMYGVCTLASPPASPVDQ